jgi:transposase
MSHPTVTALPAPNLVADTICRTAELGLSIDNAADAGDITHLYCHPVTVDPSCPHCGHACRVRDHVERRLTDLPIAGHPSLLHVRAPRLICGNDDCPVTVFRAPIPRAADDRQSVTHRVTRWILQRMAIDGMSVKACAAALGIGWDKTNQLALSACRHLSYGDPTRLDRVRVLGVDEHKWKHVRGDGTPGFVTVIVDLTPLIDGIGSARLLDMVPGRSADAFGDWLDARGSTFRHRIRVVTMDGFTGYAKAATKHLSQARQVMDPFHVVHLAIDKLTACRQRVQNETTGHRGRSGDPLYGIRRILLTRRSLVTPKNAAKLDDVLTSEAHLPVQLTWHFYQEILAAYQADRPRDGKLRMFKVIKALHVKIPNDLRELRVLGQTLWRRRADILAYFDTGASNGPVENINGKLEHLRGIALGFRNKAHYILRSVIHSGQLQDRINAL